MKISKFSAIKQHRIFKNFSWPALLPPFASKNLIYGWNGSGKSTLTEIFRAIEKKKTLPASIAINIDDRTISGSAIPTESTLPNIKVFSRQYIEENIFTPEKRASSIFYLGHESIEKQKKIETEKNKIREIDEKVSRKLTEKQKSERDLDNFCQDKANNSIKLLLRSSGANTYSNYNKSSFKTKAEIFSKLSSEQLDKKKLDEAKYQTLISLKDSAPKEIIPALSKLNFDPKILDATTKEILGTSVISKVLSDLESNPELSKWVESGLTFHKEGSGYKTQCQFCKSALSSTRAKDIEDHFNDAYNGLMDRIETLISQIERKRADNKPQSLPTKAHFYPQFTQDFESELDAFHNNIQKSETLLVEIKESLESKKQNPFKAVEVKYTIPETLNISTDSLNVVIQKNNLETSTFNQTILDARKSIEEHIVASCLDDFNEKATSIAGCQNEIENLSTEKAAIEKEIRLLELSVREDLKPAEELNQDIKSYLGRAELRFRVKDGGYELLRGEILAENLSEGEKTAIAFLHFLKSLSDKNFDLKSGIVVIDDPISSLDSNSIYHAFGFMKEKAESASQLFIFTHNHTFFRQVKNWFNHLPDQKKKNVNIRPARFYMLRATIHDGERAAEIAQLDSLLHEFESEYHYLFSIVYRSANTHPDPLEVAYSLPNISRRLLETFLAFKNPSTDQLSKKLDAVSFDTAKKSKILRFIHTYSHFDQITDSEHDPSILQESASVMKDILDLIKLTDSTHYEGLERLATERDVE